MVCVSVPGLGSSRNVRVRWSVQGTLNEAETLQWPGEVFMWPLCDVRAGPVGCCWCHTMCVPQWSNIVIEWWDRRALPTVILISKHYMDEWFSRLPAPSFISEFCLWRTLLICFVIALAYLEHVNSVNHPASRDWLSAIFGEHSYCLPSSSGLQLCSFHRRLMWLPPILLSTFNAAMQVIHHSTSLLPLSATLLWENVRSINYACKKNVPSVNTATVWLSSATASKYENPQVLITAFR